MIGENIFLKDNSDGKANILWFFCPNPSILLVKFQSVDIQIMLSDYTNYCLILGWLWKDLEIVFYDLPLIRHDVIYLVDRLWWFSNSFLQNYDFSKLIMFKYTLYHVYECSTESHITHTVMHVPASCICTNTTLFQKSWYVIMLTDDQLSPKHMHKQAHVGQERNWNIINSMKYPMFSCQ